MRPSRTRPGKPSEMASYSQSSVAASTRLTIFAAVSARRDGHPGGAQDSVANLTNRLRGSEAVSLEVEAADGHPNPTEVQGRLEQVSGVSRVMMKDSKGGRLTFEVESLQGRHIRAELARSVVNSGWNLSELRAVGLSLEDIFLQLTTAEPKEDTKEEGGQK